MAVDQFTVVINDDTLSKMLDNVIVDTLPDKQLMIDFLARLIMKKSNGSDFFMALTNTFPKILFNPGDKVRIKRHTIWYNIDDDASTKAGYIEGEGIYAEIKYINRSTVDCYVGKITYIDKSGNVETREIDFNNTTILMDNTVIVGKPSILPGDII